MLDRKEFGYLRAAGTLMGHRLALLVGLSLGAVSLADASSETDVGVNGEVTNTITGPSSDYTYTDQRLATPGVLSLITVSGTASVLTQASSNSYGGAKEGFVEADAYAAYQTGYNNSYAESTSTSTFRDDFTVESATLPVGTPVTVTFLMHIDGTILSSVQLVGYATGILTVSDPPNLSGSNASYEYYANGPSADLTETLSGAVGDRMRMLGQLRAGTYISSDTGVLDETVDLSANAYAWTDNADITLVSDSGHDFSPVPEPSSILALGLGIVTIARRRRAKRSRTG